MANIFDEIGRVGSATIGTIGDLVAAYGGTATNRVEADDVAIAAAEAQIEINRAKAASDIEAKRTLVNAVKIALIVALLLVVATVGTNLYMKARK